MLTTTTLWFVRHGETDWNTQSRIQDTTDIPLNETGLRQARLISTRLSGVSIDAIYSSPLARAEQTAMPLAGRLDLPIHRVDGLSERNFGSFQGKTPSEIAIEDPDNYRRWQDRDEMFVPSGGESLVQFRDRVSRSILDLVHTRAGQVIVVFTHGGVLDMIYRLAHDLELSLPRTWPVANAAIHHVVATSEAFRVEAWGITDHLEDPAARDELRGIA